MVIATRDRPLELAGTLECLAALPTRPPVIVVDNASRTGVGWVRDLPAAPQVIALGRNRGGAARTVGARHARTPYVAFCDDDSWWAPDALPIAADALDRHPRLALVAARTLVGPAHRPDPVNAAMAHSPLRAGSGLPGQPVLGALACATVVRRDAYLAVGGFRELLFVGGEETLLCYDLAAAGWALRYLDQVVAHHDPSRARPPAWRRRAVERRNRALVGWMRRPLAVAAADTWQLVREAGRDRTGRSALAGLVARLPSALADRHRLPPALEREVRALERGPHRAR